MSGAVDYGSDSDNDMPPETLMHGGADANTGLARRLDSIDMTLLASAPAWEFFTKQMSADINKFGEMTPEEIANFKRQCSSAPAVMTEVELQELRNQLKSADGAIAQSLDNPPARQPQKQAATSSFAPASAAATAAAGGAAVAAAAAEPSTAAESAAAADSANTASTIAAISAAASATAATNAAAASAAAAARNTTSTSTQASGTAAMMPPFMAGGTAQGAASRGRVDLAAGGQPFSGQVPMSMFNQWGYHPGGFMGDMSGLGVNPAAAMAAGQFGGLGMGPGGVMGGYGPYGGAPMQGYPQQQQRRQGGGGVGGGVGNVGPGGMRPAKAPKGNGNSGGGGAAGGGGGGGAQAQRRPRMEATRQRPCQHNQWERISKKKHSISLRCRVCRTCWKTRLEFFTKCTDFYAGECALGDQCPQPHIYSKAAEKHQLLKKLAEDGEEGEGAGEEGEGDHDGDNESE